MKTVLMLVLFLVQTTSLFAGGGSSSDGGNGGTRKGIEFSNTMKSILTAVQKNSGQMPSSLNIQGLENAYFRVKVSPVCNTIYGSDGHQKDARNFPRNSLIEFSDVSWTQRFSDPYYKVRLVLHEYLGVSLQEPSDNYSLTERVLEALGQQGVQLRSLVAKADLQSQCYERSLVGMWNCNREMSLDIGFDGTQGAYVGHVLGLIEYTTHSVNALYELTLGLLSESVVQVQYHARVATEKNGWLAPRETVMALGQNGKMMLNLSPIVRNLETVCAKHDPETAACVQRKYVDSGQRHYEASWNLELICEKSN